MKIPKYYQEKKKREDTRDETIFLTMMEFPVERL